MSVEAEDENEEKVNDKSPTLRSLAGRTSVADDEQVDLVDKRIKQEQIDDVDEGLRDRLTSLGVAEEESEKPLQ